MLSLSVSLNDAPCAAQLGQSRAQASCVVWQPSLPTWIFARGLRLFARRSDRYIAFTRKLNEVCHIMGVVRQASSAYEGLIAASERQVPRF